jgi:predicted AlkP superfamily phosphohydrolase/phosphomutase
MRPVSRRRVLAVGVDAAEPRLVLDLIERGELPALRRLRDEGHWASVRSPAHIGSGAVWPTFYTGTHPHRHGVTGEWIWRPDAMSVVPPPLDRLRPFWGSLDDALTMGLLDVPLAPHVGLSRGFEITEWGGHDAVQDRPSISPPEIVPAVEADHPFAAGRLQAREHDRVDPAGLASGCVEGAALRGELATRLLERVRPDLSILVFGEVHRAAHHLWHTVEPDDPLYDDLSPAESNGGPSLVDVYREVDSQIGRLADAMGEDAAVVVFSLHGMGPSRGIAMSLLEAAVRELGFAQPARTRLGRGVLAAAKRSTPDALKRLYYRRVPNTARYRVAGPTMMPALDWSRTRAFALPSDQHGWVRVNLRGREAEGVVAPGDYETTCEELRQALGGLRTEDGRRIVRDVIRGDPGGGPPAMLPDLVVHWSDAAFERPVRVKDPAIEAWPMVPQRTGQHRFDGFCLARGLDDPPGDGLEASELHLLLREACGR